MHFDLLELSAERSKEFIDYFNAALRARSGLPFGGSGSAGLAHDEAWLRIRITGLFCEGGESQMATICL